MDIKRLIIEYKGGDGNKERPILIVRTDMTALLVAVLSITKQYTNKSAEIKQQYFEIVDWKAAGLKVPSYIDFGSLFQVSLVTIMHSEYVGALSANDERRFKIEYVNWVNSR